MASQVYLGIGSKDRSLPWYDPPVTTVSPPIRDLLENYSHIPADEVIPRIIAIRDKIWDVFAWPCVGQFRFLDLSLSRQPSYAAIVSRLMTATVTANGSGGDGGAAERLLDVGCCLAQDLRKLVRDGVTSSSLYGLEIQAEFVELGYEFFGDRDSFRGNFVVGDLMDRSDERVRSLEGTFGVVQLGMVLHIWDLEGQTRACERVVGLLRDERGVLVVGQSVGDVEGKEVPSKMMKIYKHNVETFEEMWAEVGRRTGTSWEVRARLDEGLGIDERKRDWDEVTARRLTFEVERVE